MFYNVHQVDYILFPIDKARYVTNVKDKARYVTNVKTQIQKWRIEDWKYHACFDV